MHFPQPAFSRRFCPTEAATSQSHHTRSVVSFTFTCTHKFCHQHYDTSCILPPITLYILWSKIAKPPKKTSFLLAYSCSHLDLPTILLANHHQCHILSILAISIYFSGRSTSNSRSIGQLHTRSAQNKSTAEHEKVQVMKSMKKSCFWKKKYLRVSVLKEMQLLYQKNRSYYTA